MNATIQAVSLDDSLRPPALFLLSCHYSLLFLLSHRASHLLLCLSLSTYLACVHTCDHRKSCVFKQRLGEKENSAICQPYTTDRDMTERVRGRKRNREEERTDAREKGRESTKYEGPRERKIVALPFWPLKQGSRSLLLQRTFVAGEPKYTLSSSLFFLFFCIAHILARHVISLLEYRTRAPGLPAVPIVVDLPLFVAVIKIARVVGRRARSPPFISFSRPFISFFPHTEPWQQWMNMTRLVLWLARKKP